MIDRANVLAEVETYCEKRYPPKTPSDADFPYNGHGNTKQVSAVVSLVVDWIEGEPKARETISYRPDQTNLVDLTGMAVHELTRLTFPWTEVCAVVESAGKTSLWTGKLDKLVAKYPKAAGRFLGMRIRFDDRGENVKRVVQDLAKTIIWAQSFAFLTEHGYKNAR